MSSKPIKSQLSSFEKVRRLNYIKRCSLFPLVNPTSVAEHSFHVAIMANVFASELAQLGATIDVGLTTSLALFHDVEESVTSDIPYHVKTHLRRFLDFDRVVECFVRSDLSKHSDYLADRATQSCDGSLEWLVTKACDMGELLLYCKEEYETGNQHLLEMMTTGTRALDNLLVKIRENCLSSSVDSYNYSQCSTIQQFRRLLHYCKQFEA